MTTMVWYLLYPLHHKLLEWQKCYSDNVCNDVNRDREYDNEQKIMVVMVEKKNDDYDDVMDMIMKMMVVMMMNDDHSLWING